MVVCHPGTIPTAKSKADDTVNRKHERRRQTRHNEIGRLVSLPVPSGAAPAEGQHTEQVLERRIL